MWFAIRDTPKSVGLPELEGTQTSMDEDDSTAHYKVFVRKMVFRNPVIWFLAIADIFVYIVRFAIFDWGPKFMTQGGQGFTPQQAGIAVAAFEICGIVGMVVSGFVTDKLFKSKGQHVATIWMGLTALAVRLTSPGPALFRQKRLGLHGNEFEILKFRSMRQDSEFTGSGVYSGKGDARVTTVGKFIRATSLDELPQLINIIRGDMSLIGPRPPLTYFPWPLSQYTEEQLRMFEVRPGITGWAQTHGRKNVEWHRRIEMNVWYVDHVSLRLDLKIFFRTIFKVVSNADNVSQGETLKKE